MFREAKQEIFETSENKRQTKVLQREQGQKTKVLHAVMFLRQINLKIINVDIEKEETVGIKWEVSWFRDALLHHDLAILHHRTHHELYQLTNHV